MSDSAVLFSEIDAGAGRVFGRATLNAPATLNALSLPMVDLLHERLLAWAGDARVVGVWLDAVGDKAFCAGGDVVGLYHAIRALPEGEVPQVARDFFEREYRLDYLLHTYPKPLLCWGHGIVMGGGVGLLAGASHRVVTPRTRLAMPEITIGLYPDVGGSWFLARLAGGLGEFLALTGAPLGAADVLAAGLADFALRHEDQAAVLQAIGQAGWRGEAEADRGVLGALLAGHALGADELAPAVLPRHGERIRQLIGCQERVQDMAPRLAALAGESDPWLSQAGATFAKGSPTSAVLSVQLQRRLRHASLADVFRIEWDASLGCCAHPDFPEGVRALLVDKDKAPRWHPAAIDALDEAGWRDWIAEHLRPRGPNPLDDLG